MKEYIQNIQPDHQHDEGWCGPSSLFIALRALGIDANPSDIAQLVEDVREGLSWNEMARVVNHYGCETVYNDKATWKELVDVHYETGCPIIVAWMSDRDGEIGAHFSVVNFINEEKITLADPQYEDFVTYSRADFEMRWIDAETERAYMVIMPAEE